MNETEERKTITVNGETFEELDNRRTGTWDEFLSRLIQMHSSEGPTGEDVVLASESVDDIASVTARRTAEELETRLR